MKDAESKIILGIDPGSQVTGWGVIALRAGKWAALDFGCIRTDKDALLSARYLSIFEGVIALIEEFSPDAVSVEDQFVDRFPRSALKLGMARSSVMIAAAKKGVPLFTYPPKRAKKAIVGVGQASKEQVQRMMVNLLSLSKIPTPHDAADALMLALCHAYSHSNPLQRGKNV